jgi:SAM-dependent MidA family methyltransferase
MAAALYDPDHGYYFGPGRARWGREGDYRTSPERSILFAATFARYFASLHELLGAPAEWTIVEAGAGAGDFAAGILETLQNHFPKLSRATNYLIDERSEASRVLARERLQRFDAQVRFESLAELAPIDAGVIFANELLDAFPVHRLTVRDGKLCEFYVGVDSHEDFEWRLGELSTTRLAEYSATLGFELAEGQIAEVNLDAEAWLELAARRLKSGFLVLVDYGAEAAELYHSPARHQGSLRSFRNHQFTNNPLAQPGEQDLTTTIDWSFVRSVAERVGFRVANFERQDTFLLGAGILEELELRTDESTVAGENVKLRTEAREMILPSGMAASFQVLVLEREAEL